MLASSNIKEEEEEEEEIEDFFGMDITIPCYCGHNVKINYDETKGIKEAKCKHCGYSHMDLVYSLRKQVEEMARKFSPP